MNSLIRERTAEIAAASAMIAVLVAAISLGALFLDRQESGRVSALLLQMAEKSIVSPGSQILQRTFPPTGLSPIRRAFLYTNKDGRILGSGLSVAVSAYDWEADLLVVTDERGTVRSMLVRKGLSGIRAEDLEIFVSNRGKGSGGGLGVATDIRNLEYSTKVALEDAVRFFRSVVGSAP